MKIQGVDIVVVVVVVRGEPFKCLRYGEGGVYGEMGVINATTPSATKNNDLFF